MEQKRQLVSICRKKFNKQTNMAKTYFRKENIFPQAIFVTVEWGGLCHLTQKLIQKLLATLYLKHLIIHNRISRQSLNH